MSDVTAHGKNKGPEMTSARRNAFQWPDVLRALPGDETRSYAMAVYREAGFSADEFSNARNARETMADALSRTEDWLEVSGGHRAERAAIRDIRRQLEWELWP